MMEVAQWIFEHGERIGTTTILLGLTYALIAGKLWSNKAVEQRIADFEKREQKVIADCEYHRTAHERLLGELERALTVGKILAGKTP